MREIGFCVTEARLARTRAISFEGGAFYPNKPFVRAIEALGEREFLGMFLELFGVADENRGRALDLGACKGVLVGFYEGCKVLDLVSLLMKSVPNGSLCYA